MARKLAIRVSRAYRTILLVAVTAIAGISPVDLIIKKRVELYWRVRAIRQRHDEGERKKENYPGLDKETLAPEISRLHDHLDIHAFSSRDKDRDCDRKSWG